MQEGRAPKWPSKRTVLPSGWRLYEDIRAKSSWVKIKLIAPVGKKRLQANYNLSFSWQVRRFSDKPDLKALKTDRPEIYNELREELLKR